MKQGIINSSEPAQSTSPEPPDLGQYITDYRWQYDQKTKSMHHVRVRDGFVVTRRKATPAEIARFDQKSACVQPAPWGTETCEALTSETPLREGQTGESEMESLTETRAKAASSKRPEAASAAESNITKMDLTDRVFGELTVLGWTGERTPHGERLIAVRCSCGTTTTFIVLLPKETPRL